MFLYEFCNQLVYFFKKKELHSRSLGRAYIKFVDLFEGYASVINNIKSSDPWAQDAFLYLEFKKQVPNNVL